METIYTGHMKRAAFVIGNFRTATDALVGCRPAEAKMKLYTLLLSL